MASCNNKLRITQDIRVQTGKLDEPIISPLLTVTVSPQLLAQLATICVSTSISSKHGLARHRLTDFQTSSGLKGIRRSDIVGWEEPLQWLHPLHLCDPAQAAHYSCLIVLIFGRNHQLNSDFRLEEKASGFHHLSKSIFSAFNVTMLKQTNVNLGRINLHCENKKPFIFFFSPQRKWYLVL